MRIGLALIALILLIPMLLWGQRYFSEQRSDHFSAFPHPDDPNAIVFEWSGPIDPPMADVFAYEFRKNQAAYKTIVISLNSPGGGLDEGERVIAWIGRAKRTHTLRTYVGADKDCLSMCVPIFMQGEIRIASPSSNWMFHNPILVNSYTGNPTVAYGHERSQAAVKFYARHLKRSEIDKDWLERLVPKMQSGDVWKTGSELKRERSNIVTVLDPD